MVKDQNAITYVKQILFFLKHPIKTIENVKYDTSVNAFFSVFVFSGIITAIIIAFMPFDLFSQVLLKTTNGTSFVSTNVISVKDMVETLNSPYFRIPYYLVDFYWGEGLLIVCSITFFWGATYCLTKKEKYPAEFGDMANIFLIASFPKFISNIFYSLCQLMTNTATYIPFNSFNYKLWTLLNPFIVLQLTLIGIGISKLYQIKPVWIVSIIGLYIFLSFVLS